MSGDELRDQWNRASYDHRAQPVYTAAEYEELEAENKRLREALRDIASKGVPIQREEHRIARAALRESGDAPR